MEMNNVSIIRRGVEVILVPSGDKMNLLPGQEVLVTQAKGGSFTLNVQGNLVYLEGKDADAIGRDKVILPIDKYNVNLGDEINKDLVWDQMRTVYDPEIPVNVVELGLIYDVGYTRQSDGNYYVCIHMTLTAPGCGMGPVLVQDIETKVNMLPNVSKTDVVIVFDPPWNSEMMSEEAKLELGFF
jgi:probable FeS assembly SUF system protein SufT